MCATLTVAMQLMLLPLLMPNMALKNEVWYRSSTKTVNKLRNNQKARRDWCNNALYFLNHLLQSLGWLYACLVDFFCSFEGKSSRTDCIHWKGKAGLTVRWMACLVMTWGKRKLSIETSIQPDPHWSLLSIALRAEESWFTFKKHITCQKVLSDTKAGRHFN